MVRSFGLARRCLSKIRRACLLCCALVLCLGLGLSIARAAETDARLLRTQALMELMGAGASVEQFVNLVYQQSVAALLQANPDAGDAVQSFVDARVLPAIRAQVPAMMAAMANDHAQVFTESELEEIVAFYRSPVVQKLRRARPALLRQAVQLGQFWAADTFRTTLSKLKPEIEAQGLKAPDV